MSTRAAIEEFRQAVRGREVKNDQTLDDYCRWIDRFEQWHGGGEVSEKTVRRFDSYLHDSIDFPWDFTRPLNDSGYAYQTRLKALSALKHWFKFHYDIVIDTDVQKMVLGEEPEFDPNVLSRDDIRRVMAEADRACKATDCHAACIVGYDAIMRCAELADARIEDVDFDAGSIYVRAKKGSVSKHIGLSSRTLSVLRDHVDRVGGGGRAFLFYNSYHRNWKPKALSTHFIRSHHSVGIHSFTRHSPIVHRLQNPEAFAETMQPEDAFGQVFQRARHSHPSTTLRYARMVGIDVPDWAGD